MSSAPAHVGVATLSMLSMLAGCKPPPNTAIPAPSASSEATPPLPSSPSAAASAPLPSTSTSVSVLSAFGCELQASLVPDNATIVVGEPVYLTVRIATSCPQSLAVLDGGDYRNRLGRAETFEVRVANEAGKDLPLVDAGPSFGGLIGPRPIAAGKPFEKRLLLAHWVSLEAPGRHRIRLKKTLRVGQAMTPDEADKQSLPLALATTIDVRPASPDALGAVIARFAADLSGNADRTPEEALAALSMMQDARVVPHFVRLVNGPRTSLRFGGIMGLARYDSDDALAGLVTGLGVDGMRLTAAQTLASSVHPKAWEKLWELRADPDSNVRLTVLHALAKRDGADIAAKIAAFRKDPAPIVAGEAARYETERRAKR